MPLSVQLGNDRAIIRCAVNMDSERLAPLGPGMTK
jgi:hypothetical protein